MNDTTQKRGLQVRTALSSGPIISVVLFCLAYGSVMALVLAPRGILTAGSTEDSPHLSDTGTVETGAPQVLKAGFTARPAVVSVYGITD